MRKILLIILLTIAFNYSEAQIRGPKISFSEMEFDFGDVPQGPGVEHNFVVTNTGDALLDIQRVKASCGCTVAKLEKDKLEPNESTNIKVSFSTYGRTGMNEKYVYVNSNDPENEQVRLKFTANVVKDDKPIDGPSIALDRKIINLGNILEGNKYDLAVKISNKGTKPLVINKIKSSCGCTTTKLSKESLTPGEEVELKIELDTEGRIGKMTRTISVLSDDPVQPEQIITIVCDVKERKS